MTETITIRPYTSGDQALVLDLLRLSLGETQSLQRTPELFTWKHLDNPFEASIMLVAEAEEKIVGFRAFMRWELTTPSGDTIRCVRPVDTATHPSFQRRGIFRRLTLEAVDAARADGTHLIFNTPNPRSAAGYASMGWSRVGSIGVLIRPSFRFLARRGRSEQTGWKSEQAGAFEFDPYLRPARGLRTPRRPEYLSWRFQGHPTARYSVFAEDNSAAVVRRNIRAGRRELVISELFGDRTAPLVAAARRDASADYVVGSFATRTPERAAAMRSGMIPVPALNALTLYARPLVDLGIDLAVFRSWDLTLGDLELL